MDPHSSNQQSGASSHKAVSPLALNTTPAAPGLQQLQQGPGATQPGLAMLQPASGQQKGLEGSAAGAAPPRNTTSLVPSPVPKPTSAPPTAATAPSGGAAPLAVPPPRPPPPPPPPPPPAAKAVGGGALETLRNSSSSGVKEANGIATQGKGAAAPAAAAAARSSPEVAAATAAASATAPAGPSPAGGLATTGVAAPGIAAGGGAAGGAAALAEVEVLAVKEEPEVLEVAGSKKRGRVLTSLESRKREREMQLKDFLVAVKEYGSTVPGEATRFHLQRGGLSTSNNQIVTLMSLAADHLVAGIVHDSSLFRNLRLQRPGERAREENEAEEEEDGQMLSTEDLSMSLGKRGIYVTDGGALVRRAGPAAIAAAAAAAAAKEDDVA